MDDGHDTAGIDPSVVLGVEGVSKQYVRIRALDDVTVHLHRGEALALIGANGAGKSTLVRILTGATEPDGGTVIIDGARHRLRSVRDARLKGIGFVPQELGVAPDLTLAENLLAGGWQSWSGMVRTKPSLEAVQSVAKRVGLTASPRQLARNLSPGERRLAMIARSLMVHPRTLILDEPTAALADKEADRIVSVLRELHGVGISIVYISHRLAEIERLCDTVVVLRDGRVVMDAPATAESVARSVVVGMAGGANRPTTAEAEAPAPATAPGASAGAPVGAAAPQPAPPPAEVVGRRSDAPGEALRCTGLRNQALRDVSFDVRVGEIVGLAGLLGAGRTEILRAIAGADPLAAGELRVFGEPVSFKSTTKATAKGVALIPEDRRNQGGLLGLSIRENLVLPAIPARRGGWLNRPLERTLTDEAVRQFGIKCPSPDALLQTLSGGNQQKVILARWIMSGARLLLLDEPTAGIDVVAKQEIMALITTVVREGRAAVLVSSELAELREYCDRIFVVRNGRIQQVCDRGVPLEELARMCGEQSVVGSAMST
jgi:ABC-type sugar transport system ATPase subunit